MDKLLNDIQLEFRNKYKDDLEAGVMRNYEFNEDFNRLLKEAELRSKLESQAPTRMRTFEESKKSQKTVASLKIGKNEKNKESAKNSKKGGSKNKKPEVMEEGIKYSRILHVHGHLEIQNFSLSGEKEKSNFVSPSDLAIFCLLYKILIIYNNVLGDFLKISNYFLEIFKVSSKVF